MISFEIYSGKREQNEVGADIVCSLIKDAEIPPYEDYKIFFDNYFSSAPLFPHLADEAYCATGSIQEGRRVASENREVENAKKKHREASEFRTDINKMQ